MDLDAFVEVHTAEWVRLDELSRRRRLNGEQVDELVTLYQRAATHLSVVRSAGADAALAARLSSSVARARATITGGYEPFWREGARFVMVSFPAAVYRARWAAFAAFAFSAVIALALGIWVAHDPAAQGALGSRSDVRQLVDQDFAGYYHQNAPAGFAAKVWTNNAWVAAQCIALGVLGVPVVYVLVSNAANVGAVGGLMAAHGRLALFFGLITPHGLLELTAVFVAAGAGLRLFWSWVDPGPRSRPDAMAAEGRSMVTVAMGLVGVLAVSGAVEAFVTPSPLPTWARIGIGVVVWLGFGAYVLLLGRPAVLAGQTGDLRPELSGDSAPVSG